MRRANQRGDRRVVAGGAGEGLGRQAHAPLQRQMSLGLAQLLQHALVVGRVDDDRRERMVLGGRPDHRRAADVDVLDDLLLVRVAARDGLLERIQVHAHQIDLLDLLLGGRVEVAVVVAPGQQPRVQARVQRLHASVHDLREAREVLDVARGDARAGELARRAAGRDDLHAQLLQAACEVDDSGLLGDRQQRPAHAHLAGRGPLDPGLPAGGGLAL